jgi:hypothetical protein
MLAEEREPPSTGDGRGDEDEREGDAEGVQEGSLGRSRGSTGSDDP